MTAPAVTTPAQSPTAARLVGRTRRGVELALLIFAMVVVLIYSAAVETGLVGAITSDVWALVLILFLIFLGVHIAVRILAPYADPVLLPTVALLNGIGVAFLRRLDLGAVPPEQRADLSVFTGMAFRQIQWTAAAALGAVVLLMFIRDHRVLSRYAYTLGLVGIVLVMIPALLPAKYSVVNGAKLWILVGGFSIQPGEFAKLALLSFFAYYLVRKREVLSLASKRILGVDFPRGRDLGPVLVVWLLSLMVLDLREGPRHLVDVLRHVRGDALHRHRALELAHHRSAAVLRRRLRGLVARRDRRRSRSSASPSESTCGSTRSPTPRVSATRWCSRCWAWARAACSGPARARACRTCRTCRPVRGARGAQRLRLRRHR